MVATASTRHAAATVPSTGTYTATALERGLQCCSLYHLWRTPRNRDQSCPTHPQELKKSFVWLILASLNHSRTPSFPPCPPTQAAPRPSEAGPLEVSPLVLRKRSCPRATLAEADDTQITTYFQASQSALMSNTPRIFNTTYTRGRGMMLFLSTHEQTRAYDIIVAPELARINSIHGLLRLYVAVRTAVPSRASRCLLLNNSEASKCVDHHARTDVTILEITDSRGNR